MFFIAAMFIYGQQPSLKVHQAPPASIVQFVRECLTGNGNYCLGGFESMKTSFGFDSTTKISDVKVGEPIGEYYIDRDSIHNAEENRPVSKFITRTNEWMVPLLENDKVICFYNITTNNEGKVINDGPLGSHTVAVEWQKMLEKWPQVRGYHPIIIDAPTKVNRIYFHVPEHSDTNLTQLWPPPWPPDTSSDKKKINYFESLKSSKEAIRNLKSKEPSHYIEGGVIK